jgi:hypothetical protein
MASKGFTAVATGAVTTRADAAAGTTNGSAVVTDAAAVAGDVGKPVSGAGIPAGSYILSVAAGVSFTMSQPATATAGPITATVGYTPADAGVGKTYRQFNLKKLSPASDAVVALETSPDGSTWTEQCRAQGTDWAYAGSNHTRRYARCNVIGLGTGAPPVSAVISYY